MKKILFVSIILIGLFAGSAAAQTKVRVKFAKGANSATVKGNVAGYNYIDYRIKAKSGQNMSVNLTSSHPACSFVIFIPI